MDWLRRNWPDLAIGIALMVVIALIVATLLSGGSLASLVQRDAPPELGATTESQPSGADVSTGGEAGSASQTGEDATSDAADLAGNTAGDGGEAGSVDVFVPGVPGQTPGTATGGSLAETPTTEGDTSEGQAEGADAQPDEAQEDAAQTTAENGLPAAQADGGFRVAAGAVPSRESASDLAQSYRDAGYTVTVAQQNDLYLLWIGPYGSRADADRVAAQIVADGGDALVYTYTNPAAGSAAGDGANGDATTGGSALESAAPQTGSDESAPPEENAPQAPADATQASPESETADAVDPGETAPATGNYLQVGAFETLESAEPLQTQLGALDLSVTTREGDSGLVRVFVGPFDDQTLTDVQSRLDNEGIVGSFPATP